MPLEVHTEGPCSLPTSVSGGQPSTAARSPWAQSSSPRAALAGGGLRTYRTSNCNTALQLMFHEISMRALLGKDRGFVIR